MHWIKTEPHHVEPQGPPSLRQGIICQDWSSGLDTKWLQSRSINLCLFCLLLYTSIQISLLWLDLPKKILSNVNFQTHLCFFSRMNDTVNLIGLHCSRIASHLFDILPSFVLCSQNKEGIITRRKGTSSFIRACYGISLLYWFKIRLP